MGVPNFDYEHDEQQRKEREEVLALQFDGAITLVAIVRCAAHCGRSLTLYPSFNEQITKEVAASFFEKYGWRRSSTYGWLCPTCQSTLPRTRKVASS